MLSVPRDLFIVLIPFDKDYQTPISMRVWCEEDPWLRTKQT